MVLQEQDVVAHLYRRPQHIAKREKCKLTLYFSFLRVEVLAFKFFQLGQEVYHDGDIHDCQDDKDESVAKAGIFLVKHCVDTHDFDQDQQYEKPGENHKNPLVLDLCGISYLCHAHSNGRGKLEHVVVNLKTQHCV